MIGRLQFKHEDKLYTSKEAIRAMLDVTVKDIDGKYALFAEPIVFKYGENANDPSTWNIVLAIGKYGDGTQHSKNDYFLIDIAGAEREIEAIKQELNGQQEEIDRILGILDDLEERLSACEGKIEVLFDDIERIDGELAKKIEFPDLKLIYDPKNDENNGGAIRLEWSGYTYTNTQSIPIRDFIKDAMVREASVIIKEDGKYYLHIVWNDEAEKASTDIPLNMLVDIYTVSEEDGSTDYLRIDNDNILHVNVWNGESPYDGLATGSQVHDLTDSINQRMEDEAERVNGEIADLKETDSVLADTINQHKSEIDGEIADLKEVDNVLANTINQHKSEIDGEIADLKETDNALAEAINEVSDSIAEYDIVKTDELTYSFRKDGVIMTTINIPKDMFVSHGEVKDGYIYLYLNVLDDEGLQRYVSFPIDSLIDVYTVKPDSQQYMTIDGYTIGLSVDVNNGLASYETAKALGERIDGTNEEIVDLKEADNALAEAINNVDEKKLEDTDIKLVYESPDSDNSDGCIKLVIKGVTAATGQSIPVRDFIKDGMIRDVAIIEHSLVITWNTDAGDKRTIIPLSDFFPIYGIAEGSEEYISIDPDTNQISIKIGSEEDPTGLAAYSSLKALMDKVGEGFENTTITEEIENIKEIIENIEPVYSPDLEGSIMSPISVGGVDAGTMVSDLSGKSMTHIFNEVFFPEIYPSAPTSPKVASITQSNNNATMVVGSTMTIGSAVANVSAGQFNASFANPVQPTPVYTSEISINAAKTGFTNYTVETVTGNTYAQQTNIKVGLGTNKVLWNARLTYGAPTNKPKTSYNNETTKTGKTAADNTAIWAAGTHNTVTKALTVTGVYPIFTNINGSTLTNSADYQFGNLSTSTTSPEIAVPSESVSQQHFMIDYPASKDVTDLLIKDLSGEFISFSAPYTKNAGTVTHTINGTNYNYKRLIIEGSFLGECTYKLVLNSGLNVA